MGRAKGVESKGRTCQLEVTHQFRQGPNPHAVFDLREEVVAVDEHRLHAHPPRPHHTAAMPVAHIDRFWGLHTSTIPGSQEDRRPEVGSDVKTK